MKVRGAGRRDDEKVQLQMTPMIDIVFQLLVFFIMTFKIVLPEGDFNVKMPQNAPAEGTPNEEEDTLMRVEMKADADGKLTTRTLDGESFTDFKDLGNKIYARVSSAGETADAKVEIHCDYQLHYEYVIGAMGVISSRMTDSGEVVSLVQNIVFKPSKPAAAE
jgi:biopolymer transport protein ExbD